MWVLAVTSWIAVVIAGSALTWLAINRAGDQVSSAADAEATQPVVVGRVDAPPSARPSAKPTAKPTAKPSPSPTSTRTAAPTTTPTSAPTPRVAPSRPRTTAPSRSETRTWTGAAGFVTVSCTGSVARLQAASPNDGWSVERGDEAGDHVEVKFERDGVEVQVQALCVGGIPQFRAETGGDRSGESPGS